MNKNVFKYWAIICLLLVIGCHPLASQDLNQRYYYDGPLWQDFKKVIPLTDSTLIVATQSWAPAAQEGYQTQVSIVESDGSLLTQSTAIVNIIQNFMNVGDIGYDTDGELIVSGSILANNMMLKIVSGSVVWSKVLNVAPLNNTINDYLEAVDGNEYVMAGHRVTGDYGFITKLDETALTDTIVKVNAGDSISSIKSFKIFPSEQYGYYIITNQNRGDLLTFADSYFNILRLDDDLKVVWNRSYSVVDTSEYAEVYGFLEKENGFIATGRYNDQITFLEFDTLGNNTSAKTYTVGSDEQAGWGSCIISDNQGGYLMTTGVPNPTISNEYQSLLMNVDASGNVIWVKRYNPGRKASFKGIQWYNDNLIGYGRVVENSANLGFWISTAFGYEDCNYEDITTITQASNTVVVNHSLPTIVAKITPKQGSDAFLSTKSDSNPLDSSCVFVNDVVYPGDANYNQVANIYDLLSIGIFYNQNGPVRPNATLEWKGQWAEDWGITQASGADIKHVDTDGNGTIDIGDVIAIENNYGLTHNSSGRFPSNMSLLDAPELFVDLPQNVPEGIEFTADVILGTDDNPAEDIYGICFVIDYSNSPIPIADISFEPEPSWLGTSDSVLFISKHLEEEKRLEIGLVKSTGHNERRGIGPIGAVYIVTEDNVLGRPVSNEVILDIVDVLAIDVDENIIAVDAQSREAIVTGLKENILNSHFSIYPNPAQDRISVSNIGQQTFQIINIQILDIAGQLISTYQATQNIAIDHLAPGIYWLKIETNEGNGYYKWVKQ
ncbi:MAG: T9SS type A sorting domain-containing protein [Chitinophagales bacterium]